ncbi:sulfurtransferase [Psychromicrobium lacuslunae]|uniref:Thiosulfate sulfurtransferase n=1 Tax=Psychromicrobium lacuslunae TaxID=1618207 RepID=A0A0D4BY22_9MICC|nr:sulfurtransferase [Psychromicrobium lacuslunae]AJT41367.1 thiosulfate sulfurtransferase [Psychromicrobium lacuslunae]
MTAPAQPAILIDAATLKSQLDSTELDSTERIVLLDVRWALGDPEGHKHYLDGHLPDAVYVDLETELAGHGTPQDGRHPLPALADFQAAVRSWGVREGDLVVAYDNSGNASAARLWWLLRHAGFEAVRLLDGGLSAWREAGFELASGEVVATPGDVTLEFGAMRVANVTEVAQWPVRGPLLDARAGERYRGEVEPIDPKAGHIPGAVSAPTMGNLAADQKFLSAEQLRKRFAALGLAPMSEVAVYCGSGVTAAHEIAALEIAGFKAALFPGSWSAWSNHPDLPVETS